MHWLYFSADSPRTLEAVGFDYDSTLGYNDAVGYRAGTSQVFRLPGTRHLLELPLSIMDSALFYRDRMGLARPNALQLCRRIVSNAKRLGGTLVLNWHCRSLAPDRLWGGFYRQLLTDIESHHRVWFATGGQAVEWFRWRRSIRFDGGSGVTITAPPAASSIPAGLVRIFRPTAASHIIEERPFDGRQRMTLSLES